MKFEIDKGREILWQGTLGYQQLLWRNFLKSFRLMQERKMRMQKKTQDYDNVFKTMKMKHKRLFVSVINDVFGKDYPRNVKVEILPSEK